MALFRRILCQYRGFEAVRFCSSDQNQPRYFNKNFPEFTTHGKHSKDFGNFITRPDLATWSRVLLGSPPGYGDIDGVKGQDLIEGSLHAISSVTQSLSQNKVTDLSELLTPVCYEKLNEILQNDPNFQTPESQYALNVEHSDLFFAWMHAFVKNDRLNIVALSFPELETFKKWVVDYEESMKEHRENVASTIKKDAPPDELRDKILDYTENKKAAVHRINNHLKSNDIIISNWNFILENGDWKIDNLAMRRLHHSVNWWAHLKWSGRLHFSLKMKTPFIKVLRLDYATDYMLYSFIVFTIFYTTLGGIVWI